MTDATDLNKKISSASPTLKSFHLYGLHGLKDIKFDTESSVAILMARNGAGKTTFLSTINYILTGRYIKLNEINFDKLTFVFNGGVPVTITKLEIQKLYTTLKKSKIADIAKDSKNSVDVVLSAVLSLQDNKDNRPQYTDEIFNVYRTYSGTDFRKFYEIVHAAKKEIFKQIPFLKIADDEVKRAFGDTEIVYLPTYRRIELTLPTPEQSPFNQTSSRQRHNIPDEVKFGLSDITERLKEISLEIQRISNTTYKKISANIVNDLLDGSYRLLGNQEDTPNRSDLELFFTRLRGAQKALPYRNNEADYNIPDIDKIYSDKIDDDARPFLLYFLSNLNKAIKSTKPLEDRVTGFINACNKYLLDDDQSAYIDGAEGSDNNFKKKIDISKDDFRPHFTDGVGNKPISIDALSSGEKQMVSLFARMYLYPKRKIILYDEPELSLSMSWQSKLLPDICRASDFSQMIAITHSPFIFDNDLDAFAQNLNVVPTKSAERVLHHDDPLSELDEFLSRFESDKSDDGESDE